MGKRTALAFRLFAAGAAVFAGLLAHAAAWDAWPALPPADLELTDNEARPGSSAMILVKSDYRDDIRGVRELFYRIKIFNDEGREHANIEIPYNKREFRVMNIEARVVRASGEIAEFKGEILEKTLAKTRKKHLQAKTFTLPEIQPGDVIEYRYKLKLRRDYIFSTYWPIQERLFIRDAAISLRPAKYLKRGYSRNLPENAELREGRDGIWRYTMHDLPPLLDEALMAPAQVLQARIHVVYGWWIEGKDPATFWQETVGEAWGKLIEKYMKKPRRLRSVVETLVSPQDTPEGKLRKLYDAVQGIRNLSYEEFYTKKERWEEDLDTRDWAGDVWDLGYGNDWEIARLFTALCRAAGFDADIVFVSERDDHFFDSKLPDADQLDGELTVVDLPGGTRYFDAGTRFAPFGELGWESQGTTALRVTNKRGEFVTTPVSNSENNQLQRDITLELSPDGNAQAKVVSRYRGQRALDFRNQLFKLSDRQREHRFRSDVEDGLPGARVTKTSWVGLEDTNGPVEFHYSLELPRFAQVLGSRLVLSPMLFAVESELKSWKRESPVYIHYPYSEIQTVTIVPPQGYEVEVLPLPRNRTGVVGSYAFETSRESGGALLRRKFSIDGFIFQPGPQYTLLKRHLDLVQAGDELQLVFRRL
jgi:hypothetical protein